MSKRVYDFLRGYKFYRGKQEERKISASQTGAPLLQLYLSQTTTAVDQPNRFTKATIGSISHIGMEHLVYLDDIEQEVDMQRILPNGWKITGTADLIDHQEKVVVDYKFEMNYSYKTHMKEGPDDPYNMQGACYSWLCHDRGELAPKNLDYDFHIMSFITDHSPVKKDHSAEALQVTAVPIYTNADFEERLIAKTDQLDYHIKAKIAPDECDDLWWRVVNGKKIKTRCAYYCQYKDVCPYYTDAAKSATRVASWG